MRAGETGERRRQRRFWGAAAVLLGTAAGAVAAPASAEESRTTATATADTFVSSSAPNASYGSGKQLEADASPTKQSFVRFEVTGVGAGEVVRATLRLYVTDSSPSGGTVRAVTGPWTEATTWATRPSIGEGVAAVGPVTRSEWVEVDVTSAVAGDGEVALAITSANSDAVGYASRQTANPPHLVVVVDAEPPPPPPPPSGEPDLSTVAGPLEGSSAPTSFANAHRLAMTSGGRELVVFGRHGLGVQLAWRDAGGSWSNVTRGASVDGMLITATGTGDWTASIVVGRDSTGVEHAWAAYGGDATTSAKAVHLRRISGLDSPSGPILEPAAIVSAAGAGAGIVDLALETGASRGAVTWSARTETGSFEQRVAWFTDLNAATPPVTAPTARSTGASGYLSGTLVPTADGLVLAYRNGANRLQVDRHRATDPVEVWSAGTGGMVVPSKAHISAVLLGTGELLATAVTNLSTNTQSVQRFSAAGAPGPIELAVTGYRDGSLASDGTAAWLVAIRSTDGAVVSRHRAAGAWSDTDAVEIGPEGGGGYAWPNLLRQPDGWLRLVVQGPAGGAQQRAVLSWIRPL